MSWLTINGIDVAGLAAISSQPTGEHRDIGAQHEAADGSLSVTRQVRKRDFKFESVPLSGADAFAWESLLIGEGHAWSFDVSTYSSKGLAPTTFDGSLVSTSPDPKFGAKYLRLALDDTFECALGYSVWTLSAWAYDSTWKHFVIRSDGAKWEDGERDDSLVPPFLYDITAGVLTLTGPDPGPANIDDLVVCPYLWLGDWAAQVFAAGQPFGAAPSLTAAGLMVPEAATRSMLCVKCDERIMKANLSDGEGMAPDVRVLSVELKAR